MDDIIVIGSGQKDEKQSAFEQLAAKVGVSLDNIYDRLMWIWYMFDVSGSMDEHIRKESLQESDMDWTGFDLDAARDELSDILTEESMQAQELEVPFEVAYDPKKDEDVKRAAMDGLLSQRPRVRYNSSNNSPLTKLNMAKKAAKQFMAKRYEKYPDAKVGVVQFSSGPRLVVAGEGKDPTMAAVDGMQDGGGTYIFGAVQYTLNKTKKSKGAAPHHLIMISDGQDYSTVQLMSLLPDFKVQNAVLDVIFICGASDTGRMDDSMEALKKFAEATGGTVEFVDNEKDFEQKFLAVSERKLLTTGSGVKSVAN